MDASYVIISFCGIYVFRDWRICVGIDWFSAHLFVAFPFKSKAKIYLPGIASNFVKSLVYMMANVRKVHINKEFADF